MKKRNKEMHMKYLNNAGICSSEVCPQCHPKRKDGMKSMICKKCGKENNDNAKYCSGCGKKLKKDTGMKKGGIFVVIGVLSVVIGGIVVLRDDIFTDNIDWQNTEESGDDYKETADRKTNEEYKLNETFEFGGLYFYFTKAFANEEYGFWESSSDENVLAGFEGTVRNNLDHDVNLQDFSYNLEFINGNGKSQQTTEPRVECYAATGDFSTSSIIGAGQEGDIYVFLSPDADCEVLKMTMQTSDESEVAVVKNTFYCSGSYENDDSTSFVRMAKGYSEDLACVQFFANERECYGYIDKNADMKFYFSSKYEDGFCEPPTDFENGYIHYEYGNTVYVINKDGEITSKYDDDCVAYGSGYTCVETDTSGFDGVGYEYTFYRPDGTVVETFNSERKATVEYLGNGVFLYQYYDDNDEKVRKYYLVESGNWVAADMGVDTEDIKVCDKWLYNGIFSKNARENYIDLYDKNGEHFTVSLPDELYAVDVGEEIWLCDISDKYILLESETEDEEGYEDWSFWIYDMDSKKFKNYRGKYMDNIDKRGYYNKIFQDSIALSLRGGDENDYIGLVNIEDLSETGEPIQIRDVEVYKDVMVVQEDTSSDVQQTLYDSKGNVIYTYTKENYSGWLGGFNDNTMVAGCGYNFNDQEMSRVIHKFMDYSGKSLFDEINYSSGSETELSTEMME